ncbi:hypothetical protein FB559_0069 [Actinoallomurus bryophytorum]|uniref:Outer membrane repeat protein n=1 Tax=Actinoallomurus bryophytorum TaxID=1490222 RepID=A0A543CBZ1_9ACTN|nr:hypothetical protein FB559_0069 [Actinoallomurus bryophytorum]
MGSFSKVTGGAGAAVLAGTTLIMAFPAQSMASGPRVVKVPCSAAALAASITTANTIPSVLRLRANCTYSITTPTTVATGLPAITGNVTLTGGPGTTIRRDPAVPTIFRILDVVAGGTLRVTGIAIANGASAGLGGGIQNAGTLVLRRVTMSGNRAGNGGGVSNAATGTATISRSLLNANTTTSVGGGGLINFGTLTVTGSIISANVAPINGGGLNTQPGGISRLVRTTLDHNTSGGLGGGLSNLGTTSLDRTLVSANRGSSGGGIASGNTNVTLVRSIVRNNIPDNCNPLNTIPGCVG